jgi:hypothetical protein
MGQGGGIFRVRALDWADAGAPLPQGGEGGA